MTGGEQKKVGPSVAAEVENVKMEYHCILMSEVRIYFKQTTGDYGKTN